MAAHWATPAGWTVESMYLELVKKPKRHYDPAGVKGKLRDGTYLLVRDPSRLTVQFVTGQRTDPNCARSPERHGRCRCRTDADALAEVGEVLARQGRGEGLSDLARIDPPDDDLADAA